MSFSRSTIRLSEADIERTCSDLLAAEGWRKLKTDPVSDRSTIQTVRRMVAGIPALNHVRELIFSILAKSSRGKGFGELGMADCLYIRYRGQWQKMPEIYAQVLWIEWKSSIGKPKPHQIEWHRDERFHGALTLIAGVDFPASIEGFQAWYASSGLSRKVAA